MEFSVIDVSGAPTTRALWRHQYHDVAAVVYVVDISNRSRIEEARKELETAMKEVELRGLPVLIYANKIDVAGAMPVSEFVDLFKVCVCVCVVCICVCRCGCSYSSSQKSTQPFLSFKRPFNQNANTLFNNAVVFLVKVSRTDLPGWSRRRRRQMRRPKQSRVKKKKREIMQIITVQYDPVVSRVEVSKMKVEPIRALPVGASRHQPIGWG